MEGGRAGPEGMCHLYLCPRPGLVPGYGFRDVASRPEPRFAHLQTVVTTQQLLGQVIRTLARDKDTFQVIKMVPLGRGD